MSVKISPNDDAFIALLYSQGANGNREELKRFDEAVSMERVWAGQESRLGNSAMRSRMQTGQAGGFGGSCMYKLCIGHYLQSGWTGLRVLGMISPYQYCKTIMVGD